MSKRLFALFFVFCMLLSLTMQAVAKSSPSMNLPLGENGQENSNLPSVLETGVTVWDMEALPDSFPDWLIDKYVELGWRQLGEVASGAGYWVPSGVNGKGYAGSRAMAWTQYNNEWGNATWVVLGNDKTVQTDWSGANELYFYMDASAVSENVKTEILLYTAGNGALALQKNATWYYWQNGQWQETATNDWGEMVVPMGFSGWIRLPIAGIYGNCDLKKILRIGFTMTFSQENVTIYIDQFMLDKSTAHRSFDAVELEKAKTQENLIPDAAGITSADYFCTWNTQAAVCNSTTTVRDVLNDEALFGENGWAYFFDADTRKDLIIVLDDGWDLPYSENGTDNADYYGSFILDEKKFPGYGETYPERLKTFVDKLMAAGWKGVGVWVCCQEDKAHTTGKGWDPAYWAERIDWSKEAGITYWKIDWGNYCYAKEWREMISDLAERLYPELIIEHITGDTGTNDPMGTGDVSSKIDRMAEIASFSDVFRTYDVTTQLSMSTTFERAVRLLGKADSLKGDQMGLINCDDELYLPAALGLSGSILRSKVTGSSSLDEIKRMVTWHRLAPSFDASAYPVQISDSVLSDAWHFNGDTWDSSINGKTITQYAPAAVGRGIDLPTASGEEVPFLAACRNALTGAISIGTFRRTSVESQNHLVYSDVCLNVGSLTGPIGVFGCYSSLKLTFDQSIEGKHILAQDLIGNAAYDITNFVTVSGNTLTISGDLLEYIGTSAATKNDTSEPGLLLQIGTDSDWEKQPDTKPRTANDSYSVTLSGSDGCVLTAKSNSTVTRGGSFLFTAETSSGYDAGTLTVRTNGVILKPVDGIYCIDKIYADQTVTATCEKHEHIYENYSQNETEHWKVCTDPSCPDADRGKTDIGAHVYDEDADTTCNVCGYVRRLTPPEPTVPEITGGRGARWTQGSGEELVFTFNTEPPEHVSVDGRTLAEGDYLSEGTTLRLKPAYLSTLSVGKHMLKVQFAGGEVSAEFTVAARAAQPQTPATPQTGDRSSLLLWAAALLGTGSTLLAAALFLKKKKLQ